MEQMVKYRLRGLFLAILLVMFGVASGPAPAQADPHVVSYTPIGQQQLFFNTLAALNQADYVETLQLRQQLAQKRDANYVPSSAAALTNTQTELTELLTRSVTLEGQDVATQQRSGDYALQIKQERETGEIVKKTCQDAFGVKDCIAGQPQQPNDPIARKFIEESELAFIKDPLAHELIPFNYGVMGALLSGTPEREALVQELTKGKRQREGLPLAYSEIIAQARESVKNNPGKKKAFENFIGNIASKYVPSAFNPKVFDSVVMRNGQLQYREDSRDTRRSGRENVDNYMATALQLMTMPHVVQEIADAAKYRVAQQVNVPIVDGTIPDRVQKTQLGIDGKTGEVFSLVAAPARSKIAGQELSVWAPFLVANNPQFADPAQIANPAGQVSAVDEKGDIKIGTPLKPYGESTLIKDGLMQLSGVEDRKGLNRSFFQENVERILDGVNGGAA